MFGILAAHLSGVLVLARECAPSPCLSAFVCCIALFGRALGTVDDLPVRLRSVEPLCPPTNRNEPLDEHLNANTFALVELKRDVNGIVGQTTDRCSQCALRPTAKHTTCDKTTSRGIVDFHRLPVGQVVARRSVCEVAGSAADLRPAPARDTATTGNWGFVHRSRNGSSLIEHLQRLFASAERIAAHLG